MADFQDTENTVTDPPKKSALSAFEQFIQNKNAPPQAPNKAVNSNPFADLVLKKKEVSPQSLPSGSSLLNNGGVPSQNSPLDELKPQEGLPYQNVTTSPQAQQQAEQQSNVPNPLQGQIDTYWKHLSPDEQKHLSDFTQNTQQAHSKESLGDATAENKHYQFMQSPLGKVIQVPQYLGSQATHGGLAVMKGLAHNYSVAMNDPAAQASTDAVFDKADNAADLGLTKGDISRIDNGSGGYNKLLSASGMAANFTPTILGGEALNAPKALLYLQGVGQGKEIADKMPDLHPLAKEALIQGSGAVNLILSDLGDKLFNDIPAAIKSKITTAIAGDAIKDAAGQAVTAEGYSDLLHNEANNFLTKLQTGGIKAAEHYADNIKTFAKLKGANFLMHKAVDVTNEAEGGKPVFNESLGNLAEGLSNTPIEALPFTAIPALRSITHGLIDAKEQEKQDLGQRIQELDQHIQQIQPLMDKETDPVKKVDAEVGIENLNKLKEEAYKKLKGITVEQHAEMAKPSIKQDEPNKASELPAEVPPESPKTDVTKETAKPDKAVDKATTDNQIADNYPYPKKPLEDMNSDELYDHAKEIKQHLKDQEKEFFGEEGAKEYNQAQAVSNSTFSSYDKRKEAAETIDKYEKSLTPEQSKAFFGENSNENQHDPAEIRDIATKVNFIENSENSDELAGSIKKPLMDFKADAKDSEAKILLKAAARKAGELGIDPKEMLKKGIEKIVAELPGEKGQDLDGDKEVIVKSILSELAKTSEKVSDNQKQIESNPQITTNQNQDEKSTNAEKGYSKTSDKKANAKGLASEKGDVSNSGVPDNAPEITFEPSVAMKSYFDVAKRDRPDMDFEKVKNQTIINAKEAGRDKPILEDFAYAVKQIGYPESINKGGTENDKAVKQPKNDTSSGAPQDTGDKTAQAEPSISKLADNEQRGSERNPTTGERGERSGGTVDIKTLKKELKDINDKFEASNNDPKKYIPNSEKLKLVDRKNEIQRQIESVDELPVKPLANLSEKGKASIDKDIEHHGVTFDQVKDYEQARKSAADLPTGDAKQPQRVSEDVQQQRNDESPGTDKNIKGEGLRKESEQPENTSKDQPNSGDIKGQELKQKLEDAKKELDKAVKKSRSETNSGVNPEMLKAMAKVVKAYADIGIHKFSEMVKDWINTYGKDNFTDEDADMFKSAYAAHVANLEPKERKNFNNLKELDEFMGDGMKTLRGLEPVASLPKRELPTSERLPTPTDQKEKKEGKESYSWLGRFKDNRVRNLEQLKQFAKDTGKFDPLREVRKFATSKSQASVILKTATQKIIGLVGKEGWHNLREALVESRLRGAKERWNNFATDIANKTDSQTKEYFADGKTGQMYDLLDNLKGIGEENPASFATSLITAGRYEDARTYLSDVFKQTADNVLTLGKLSNGKTFDEQVKDGKFNDPKMQQALDAYKQFIETPIAESHESNEGIFSDALGDLDTYYPLTPTADEDKHFTAGAKPYKAPLNPNNRFATGQSENYSTDISDLSDNLAKSIKTNNKANAIDALKKAGLIVDIPHNEKETGTINLNGETYKAEKFKVAEGHTIVQDGQIINTQSKYVAMPTWLAKELKPIFDANSEYDKYSALGSALNTLVKYQLGGPIEATAHSMRLLGGITNSMPFMQEWAYKNGVLGKAGGLVANSPFVKTFVGMGKILFTDLKSDKALQTIQEMAKNGDIPEKTWTKTWSREFAELTGAKASRIKLGKLDIPNFTDFSPILYGKYSLDLKARVTMYNLTKAMNPEATPEMHTKMQQQLGVYTKSLQSNLEKFVKHHGIAPFYSFGSAIYREGIKAVVGSSSLPLERPTLKESVTTGIGAKQMAKVSAYKAAQLLSTGILGTTAYWMATYHAQTDKWPWEDENSKLLRLPFPEWAKNDFTKSHFYNEKTGAWSDFDFAAYANPYLNRGLRAVGAPKAYETAMLGGNTSQIENAGFLQALNTSISPYTSSPIGQLAINQVSGSAPYITNNTDDKGKPSIGLFRKVRTMPSFPQQQAANAEVGFQSLNPVADFMGTQATNMLGIKGLKAHADEGDANTSSAFNFALGIAFPRLFTPHGDDDTKSFFVDKEQKALEKEAEKEAE